MLSPQYISPSPLPFADVLGGKERLERACQHVRRHAEAGIADGGHHVLPRLDHWRDLVGGIGGLDRQAPAVRHCVARVEREVEHRVLELARIDGRKPQVGGIAEFDPDVLADRAAHQRFHVGQQLAQVGRTRLQHLAAPKGE
jgi:hypothetical protein